MRSEAGWACCSDDVTGGIVQFMLAQISANQIQTDICMYVHGMAMYIYAHMKLFIHMKSFNFGI